MLVSETSPKVSALYHPHIPPTHIPPTHVPAVDAPLAMKVLMFFWSSIVGMAFINPSISVELNWNGPSLAFNERTHSAIWAKDRVPWWDNELIMMEMFCTRFPSVMISGALGFLLLVFPSPFAFVLRPWLRPCHAPSPSLSSSRPRTAASLLHLYNNNNNKE